MPGGVGDQATARVVVEHVADQGARLTPVVILGVQGIRGAQDLAVGRPLRLGLTRIVRGGTAFGVRGVDRIVYRIDAHRTVLGVAVHLVARPVDRNLLIVGPDPGAMRIGVGEDAAQQHLVGAEPDAGHHVARCKGRLLDLCVMIDRIGVQGHAPDLDQRIVAVRPHLGQVKRVEPVVLCIVEGHQLHVQRPAGVIARSRGSS